MFSQYSHFLYSFLHLNLIATVCVSFRFQGSNFTVDAISTGIFTTLPRTNAQPQVGLNPICKYVSTGDIRHSSIGYSCNCSGCSGKPIPFFTESLGTLPSFIAKRHVLHNHSLLLTEVKPVEHSANMFCSICVMRNNLLTSYTEDLNHVCKQTIHTYKGPYSVFSLNMCRQSAIVLPFF